MLPGLGGERDTASLALVRRERAHFIRYVAWIFNPYTTTCFQQYTHTYTPICRVCVVAALHGRSDRRRYPAPNTHRSHCHQWHHTRAGIHHSQAQSSFDRDTRTFQRSFLRRDAYRLCAQQTRTAIASRHTPTRTLAASVCLHALPLPFISTLVTTLPSSPSRRSPLPSG